MWKVMILGYDTKGRKNPSEQLPCLKNAWSKAVENAKEWLKALWLCQQLDETII